MSDVYWLAANVVLGLHMAVLAGVSIGVVVAALGILRRHPRLSLGFWVMLLITALWQPIPSCILTDIEKWLRHQVEPGWDRTISVQRMLIRELTVIDVPERVFWWLGLVLVVVAGYAFWKHHRDQARGLLAWLMRRSGGV
jgi:hypothetical protein